MDKKITFAQKLSNMKNKTSLFISFIIFFLFSSSINAQEKTDNSWNIKLGYSRINNRSLFSGNFGEFSMESNYRLNKLLETGLYAGYTTCGSGKKDFSDDGTHIGMEGNSAPVLSYGINSYINFSSLFFPDNFRLGFRVIVKPGGFIIFSQEGFEPKGHYFTFRPGLGIDYRLFKKMGIFCEYVYGFGDGKYRAIDGIGDFLIPNQKHIGSFRFGINIPL